MSKYYEKILKYYQKGIYNKTHLNKLLSTGAISEEEYQKILASK